MAGAYVPGGACMTEGRACPRGMHAWGGCMAQGMRGTHAPPCEQNDRRV